MVAKQRLPIRPLVWPSQIAVGPRPDRDRTASCSEPSVTFVCAAVLQYGRTAAQTPPNVLDLRVLR
eukprot:SAG11_NODE_3529_length_2389_cov_19.404803_2_plen_66_part_00